jgi:hypothetical protein
MKKMSNVAWLFLLLVGFDAQAFYNPTTGRWLSRDPIEERGGASLYDFAANRPLELFDRDGRSYSPWPGHPPLEFPPSNPYGNPLFGPATKFIWAPKPCGKGMRTEFIQVGWWAGKVGFVDSGGLGASDAAECPPFYPSAANGGFEDTPGNGLGLNNPLLYGMSFVVCRVCVEPCCSATEPQGKLRIVSIGPCARYRIPRSRDVDDLSDDLLEGVPADFAQVLSSRFPRVAAGHCFSCRDYLSKPPELRYPPSARGPGFP